MERAREGGREGGREEEWKEGGKEGGMREGEGEERTQNGREEHELILECLITISRWPVQRVTKYVTVVRIMTITYIPG